MTKKAKRVTVSVNMIDIAVLAALEVCIKVLKQKLINDATEKREVKQGNRAKHKNRNAARKTIPAGPRNRITYRKP